MNLRGCHNTPNLMIRGLWFSFSLWRKLLVKLDALLYHHPCHGKAKAVLIRRNQV